MKTFNRVLVVGVAIVLVALLGFAGLVASAFVGNAPLPERAALPGGARLVKDGMVALFVLAMLAPSHSAPQAGTAAFEAFANAGR